MTDDEPIAVRLTEIQQEDPPPPDVFEESMVDRRPHAQPSLTTWQRPWSRVTGICLHQTACEMGERDSRYDKLNVHFVVCRSGKVLRLHDLTTGLAAANGWNNQTVSIEIDGLYAGVEDDPATVNVNEAMRSTWDDPSTPFREQPQRVTPEAMESARMLVRWIVGEVALHGGRVGVLVAHRQSSGSRQSDPGEAIWKAVALHMHAELGLHDGGVGFKLDDGRPIPDAWSGQANGTPY